MVWYKKARLLPSSWISTKTLTPVNHYACIWPFTLSKRHPMTYKNSDTKHWGRFVTLQIQQSSVGDSASLRNSPAASRKALLRWKVSSGSGRFLRKSLRTPVMTLISSTLLSGGRVFPLISFSFSSFTKRSWPESLYRPTCSEKKIKRNHLSLSGYLWLLHEITTKELSIIIAQQKGWSINMKVISEHWLKVK